MRAAMRELGGDDAQAKPADGVQAKPAADRKSAPQRKPGL